MLVLGIETTCDETAVSVVADGRLILSNVIASQAEMHKKYGGVYPEMASRSHVDLLLPTVEEALSEAGITLKDIDLIAVASTPGLMGSLLVGVSGAKALAYALNKPIVGVNHIEAHLYAAMMGTYTPPLPAIGLVLSGGHTALLKIEDLGKYQLLGTTVDDAIGEAFDKVARMLSLPYPGGPEIEKIAKKGNPLSYPFKKSIVKEKPFHFSFSGLKTKVLYTIHGQNGKEKSSSISDEIKANIAASFQEVALTDVIDKALKACESLEIDTIYVGGGVSNSNRLREIFKEKSPDKVTVFFPPSGLSLDNGAMIAGLGYHIFSQKKSSEPLDFTPSPTNKSLLIFS